ncbi:hypothetical protein RJ641_006390 [Dillenia turbinata]|uniref:Uncharacterized protein n=1 Tax=Dillenia turbinata TaxID=194707 RepID=A0AAN8VA56_9MAGN
MDIFGALITASTDSCYDDTVQFNSSMLILGPDSEWQPIPLTKIITSAAVKKAYKKLANDSLVSF